MRRYRRDVEMRDIVHSPRPGPPEAALASGRAEAPDVTFCQDRQTAEAIADGTSSAGAALTAGRLTVRGATARLTEHREALARIDEALADA